MEPVTIREQQIARNQLTKNNWNRCKSHRDHVTSLLSQHSPSSLLRGFGAGNCNDLDLNKLSRHYTAIELIDIDLTAMQGAIEQQGIEAKDGIRLVGDTDLSESEFSTEHLADITISSCLFTQLIEQQPIEISNNQDAIVRFRAAHLDMLLRTTKPGGTVYFVTDMVSNLTARQLKFIPEEQLNGFLSNSISQRNFFTGTNPFGTLQQLKSDPRVARATLLDAWKWELGPRVFAVYGIQAEVKT